MQLGHRNPALPASGRSSRVDSPAPGRIFQKLAGNRPAAAARPGPGPAGCGANPDASADPGAGEHKCQGHEREEQPEKIGTPMPPPKSSDHANARTDNPIPSGTMPMTRAIAIQARGGRTGAVRITPQNGLTDETNLEIPGKSPCARIHASGGVDPRHLLHHSRPATHPNFLRLSPCPPGLRVASGIEQRGTENSSRVPQNHRPRTQSLRGGRFPDD